MHFQENIVFEKRNALQNIYFSKAHNQSININFLFSVLSIYLEKRFFYIMAPVLLPVFCVHLRSEEKLQMAKLGIPLF